MSHDNLLCALVSAGSQPVTPATRLNDDQDHDHDDNTSKQQQQQQQQQQQELTINRSRGVFISHRTSRRQPNSITNNKATSIRQQQRQQATRIGARKSTSMPTRAAMLCLAAAALLVAITFVGADYAAQPSQQQQKSTDTYSANGGGYDQHQQQQQVSPKAKKIQIVYIKVPLAKLKPSLAGGDTYSSSGPNVAADNSTAYASAAPSGQQQQHDSTDTTRLQQGSQSDNHYDNNQPQQLSRHQRQQQQQHHHQPSFLIPMAVVSNSEQYENSAASINSPTFPYGAPADFEGQQQQQQQQQQQHSGYLFEGPPQMGRDESMLMGPHFSMGNSQYAAMQPTRRRPMRQQHQSPMQLYHQMMAAASAPSNSMISSVSHGINHGFMSSFLLGEKEKMTAAAMRLHQQHLSPQRHQQQQLAPSPASGDAIVSSASSASNASYVPASSAVSSATPSAPPPSPSTSSLLPPSPPSTPSTSNQQAQTPSQSTPSSPSRQPKQSPGGLMPVMMMPFSHMPDSMIGQAYNAAVGQALPVESGSPANLLSSPSIQLDSQTASKQRGNNYANYGNNGINGDSGSSLGIISNASYGANGPSQLDNNSAGTGYQQSASGFANTAPYSGSGNGINTYGASVAFSDFPATQSTGSGPNHHQAGAPGASYGNQQQQQPMSSNNEPHHLQMETGNQDYGGMGQQRLRQAKKTIIPIVVQVEHAILENNNHHAAYQGKGSGSGYLSGNTIGGPTNKYLGARGHRQLGGGKRGGRKSNEYRGQQVPYGAATNESPMDYGGPRGQYIDAANAQDINKITAAINAENAASAAAALAQADMAFGNGAPAYMSNQQQQHRPSSSNHQQHFQAGNGAFQNNHNQHQFHQHQQQQQRPGAQYLQSAASVLLANTHPVIQAAASGGLASVSKLGAKLGEMIALPSMAVPGSISTLGSSLPSALSSMGVQLGQAVQQVAKEHPTAHAFARQVAQHAGLNLPNFPGQQNNFQQQQHQQSNMNHNHHHQFNGGQNGNGNGNQMQMAASQQLLSQTLSPQAQLQNLKLSIGQNLQTAAAQLMGVSQKANAQSAATLLANPLAALYPQSMNAALKQLSSMAAVANQQQQQPGSQQAAFNQAFGAQNAELHHASSSSLVPVQQAFSAIGNQQQQQQSQQVAANPSSSDPQSPTSQSALVGGEQSSSQSAKPGKSSLKSKFLSFFQPPKFISNLLSWNDRADDRNDQSSIEGQYGAEEQLANLEATGSERKSASDKVDENDSSSSSANGKKSEESASVVSNGTSEVQQTASKASPVALDSSSASASASATSAAAAAAAQAAASVDESAKSKPELEASSANSTSSSKKN